ncbi:hypothetical protein MES5069_180068 [Mesorhizobium escarrei]|uniref:Uncharacterized protein n=1 Tax=Mesorhizobium escarrei TaxID=666018 RepID=A0ABN8JM38_9HYPH|nr:hypothetical protein MES5069_180068 [Mesorhizobium escarrei]
MRLSPFVGRTELTEKSDIHGNVSPACPVRRRLAHREEKDCACHPCSTQDFHRLGAV